MPYWVIALLLVFVGFGQGWKVHEWVYAEKEKEHAEQAANAARAREEATTRQVTQAIRAQSEAVVRANSFRRDAERSRSALVSLSDASELALHNAHASHAACLDTAAAERVVLDQCAEKYRGLAEDSDRHVNDIVTLTDSWPK